ncbi:WYL domain-containing protein [Cyclobacterium sp. SYSU L10401]|uniref:WYL domain-containing protein n=1 Tax=Cyclobacterium sp. SYSU L10401 TaxID=2678657 RepID=UPI0013D5D2DB|nr:WYL domain-containing protein [Cyclobacterium sp. SYSU L10401]
MENFVLGDIVAFKSHPYSSIQNSVFETVIAGESLLTPPLMVIGEILMHNRGSYDPKDGEEIHKKGSKSCKCFWFNHDQYQFEDAWISEKQLKLIQKSEVVSQEDLLYSNVIFKTASLETGKKKSSLSSKNGVQTRVDNHILSFVAPTMQVISVKKAEEKDPKYDEKTGKQARITGKYLAKCKWFNPKGHKFSEKFMPLAVLERVPFYGSEILEKISELVKEQTTLHIIKSGDKIPILLQVSSSFCLNGKYYLQGFDLVRNKPDTFLVEPNIDFPEAISPIVESWPKFDSQNEIISIDEFLNAHFGDYKYFKIRYASFHGEVTSRTIEAKSISDYEVFKNPGDTSKQSIKHFVGHCLLRNAERRFRLERIQSIQVLNIKK